MSWSLFFTFVSNNIILFLFSVLFFSFVTVLLYFRNDNFLIVSIGLEVLYIFLAVFFCNHSILLDDLLYFWFSFSIIVLGAIDTAISLSIFASLKRQSYFIKNSKTFDYVGSSSSVDFKGYHSYIFKNTIENVKMDSIEKKESSDKNIFLYNFVGPYSGDSLVCLNKKILACKIKKSKLVN